MTQQRSKTLYGVGMVHGSLSKYGFAAAEFRGGGESDCKQLDPANVISNIGEWDGPDKLVQVRGCSNRV